MTEQEMREGFAKGRTLTQEEWSTPEEIATVDKLNEEGVCSVGPWVYRDTFQCAVRYVKGRVDGNK